MTSKDEQIQKVVTLIKYKKVVSLHTIAEETGNSGRTIQRYLKQLSGLTSYTHRGQFVTLRKIANFDKYGIWYKKEIGFSKYGSSLNSIVELVNSSKEGITKDELEAILKIQISKQIQILMLKSKLQRLKLGNKYLYLPEEVMGDKSKKLRIIGSRQPEERYEKELKITEVISVLKIVLEEKEIDMKNLKKLVKKYNLKLSFYKLENILLRYQLTEKKTQLTS